MQKIECLCQKELYLHEIEICDKCIKYQISQKFF